MTTIDQSILIPTSPEVVWEIISDINKNTRWQADYQSVSFLTSIRSGSGVRWRYSSPGGTDFVVETTAWYDGIGYEYTYIDGAPFRESKGRFRLQEIAEGTMVQWSLVYEMGGMLAGMRNSLSVRRHYEKLMANSLRGLWTYVKESGGTRQHREAKSLMRDAPDYEERAQYIPRHPSRVSERENAPVTIDEPPLSDEDTRPNPAVVAAEPEPLTKAHEPVEMQPVQISPDKAAETDENKRVETEAHRRFQPPPPSADDEEYDILVQPDPEPVIPPPPATDHLDETTVLPELAGAEDMQDELAASDEFGPVLDTSKLDTREISIWEVFGVQSPSETQRLRAIKVDEFGEPLENQEDSRELLTVSTAEPTVSQSVVADESPSISVTEPIIEAEPEAVVIETTHSAALATQPALAPVAEPLIAGYRISQRRRLMKIRRYR